MPPAPCSPMAQHKCKANSVFAGLAWASPSLSVIGFFSSAIMSGERWNAANKKSESLFLTSKEKSLSGNIAAYLDITTGIRAHKSELLTSRKAVAKYTVRKRGAIFNDCFNLSDCGLLSAACKVEDIVGDVQCFAAMPSFSSFRRSRNNGSARSRGPLSSEPELPL